MQAIDLTIPTASLLFIAGVVAGICNAIAGGGTLFSFPVFMAIGLPPTVANASNVVAVWPGHALATVGYSRELRQAPSGLATASLAALVGGAVGAYLLSLVGDGAFVSLIPFLLLAATVLFAIGPRVNRYLLLQTRTVNRSTPFGVVGFVGIFIFSIYGGFFGAGLGVMLMAGLLLIGVHEPQQNNAIKNLLATAVTSIAVVIFALSGLIAWQQTACAFVGATIGGLFGSRLARVMSPMLLRSCVIVLGCTLSVYYFVRGIPR